MADGQNAPLREFRCGFAAVLGRPNVGKSTLVNAMVGQKISIVTHKPQTTRHRILGISTGDAYQVILVDTPGFHLDARQAINRHMNRTVLSVLRDVDLVLFVTQVNRWTEEEQHLLSKLEHCRAPVLAVPNKVDLVRDKTELLPYLDQLNSRRHFEALVPVSAKSRNGIDRLKSEIARRLPEGPPLFDEEQVTDRSMRFIAAELVREQLYLTLRQELPYAVTVEVEAFEEAGELFRVAVVVWVAKTGHKSIVIGKGGAVLKRIGAAARRSMEEAFGKKVFLNVWVKVKEDWNDDERALRSLGYDDIR